MLAQIVDREARVAFVGLSNWALDPAKMNRGVMVTRGDPDRKELELSARSGEHTQVLLVLFSYQYILLLLHYMHLMKILYNI